MNNHLGDTNEMNSNDKADAAWNDYVYDNQETEIEKLQERIKRLDDIIKHQEKVIKRLEDVEYRLMQERITD